MKTLLFDNYDSFTYNIAHCLRELGVEHDVVRNDQITLDEVAAYDRIIISPGPGIPSEAGILMEMLARYADKRPILGVCLGHQALGEHFGAKLRNLDEVWHGVASPLVITAPGHPMFDGLRGDVEVGRYHSWVVSREEFPEELEITALSPDGEIMAMAHKRLPVWGVQFHPESVLTPQGITIIKNWIDSTQQ